MVFLLEFPGTGGVVCIRKTVIETKLFTDGVMQRVLTSFAWVI